MVILVLSDFCLGFVFGVCCGGLLAVTKNPAFCFKIAGTRNCMHHPYTTEYKSVCEQRCYVGLPGIYSKGLFSCCTVVKSSLLLFQLGASSNEIPCSRRFSSWSQQWRLLNKTVHRILHRKRGRPSISILLASCVFGRTAKATVSVRAISIHEENFGSPPDLSSICCRLCFLDRR